MSDKEDRKIIIGAIKDQEIEAMVFTTSIYSTQERDRESRQEFENAIQIYFSDFHLMVDSHMHIQSLNCTPVPLQWATTFSKTESKGLAKQKMKGNTRQEMNVAASTQPAVTFVHDFGRIGRLPTDLVGRVFMCDAQNNDFRRDLYWIVGADEETDRETAGEQAQLDDLSESGSERYGGNFYKNTAFYFKNNKVISQFIVLMMDLSYAHYWGQWYLPINLPMPYNEDRGFYYINDFIQVKTDKALFSDNVTLKVDTEDYVPDHREGRKIHLYHNIDLKEQLDRFILYLQSRLHLTDRDPTPFYIYFDDDTHIADRVLSLVIHSETDRDRGGSMIESLENLYTPLVKPEYTHFVEQIPGDNAEIFEDFRKQCDHTMACALQYPLQFFTFYHYDPRRHYHGDKNYAITTAQIASVRKCDDLKDSHAFFTYQVNEKSFSFSPDVTWRGDFLHIRPLRLDEITDPETGESYFDQLCKTHSRKSIGKSSGYLKSNDNMFSFINSKNNTGLFWGIKMYPALGYNPADFETYPHLEHFYQTCIHREIPVMIHSSPLGMTVGDPHNFLLRDDEFINGDLDSMQDQLLRAEEMINHPRNWRDVLSAYNKKFKTLKICLAHFGGESLWKNPLDRPRPVNDKPDTRGEILDMIGEFPNVYTDIACYTNVGHSTLAKHLTQAFESCAQLRKRLMMGSDWYMMVPDMKDAPRYYNKMFKLFKQISKNLGYDAWYECTVVNPLRFLGFLDPDEDMDNTSLNLDRVYGFRECAREKVKDKKMREYYNFTEDDMDRVHVSMKDENELEAHEARADSILMQMQKMRIKRAEDIIGEAGTLRILQK